MLAVGADDGYLDIFSLSRLFLSSSLADNRDIVVTILVRCMCVRQCVHACVRPDFSGL